MASLFILFRGVVAPLSVVVGTSSDYLRMAHAVQATNLRELKLWRPRRRAEHRSLAGNMADRDPGISGKSRKAGVHAWRNRSTEKADDQ